MDLKWIIIPSFFLACAAMGCGKPCSKGSDCGKDQCCVVMRPKHRTGVCRKLAEERKSCNMPEEVIKKDGEKYFMACPCQDGLVCTAKAAAKEYILGPLAVLQLKCIKGTRTEGKPAQGDDGVEVVYEEMDGDKISEEEVLTKEIKKIG